MPIHVKSEVDALQEVLVHRPGAEIIRMTQHELDVLLFDDILSPAETELEHDLFSEILSNAGAVVRTVQSALATALDRAPSEARSGLLAQVSETAGQPNLSRELLGWPAEALSKVLIEGLYEDQLEGLPVTLEQLRTQVSVRDPRRRRKLLPPIPNLMFMRDPCVALYDRVLVGRMATEARAREPLLVAFAVRHGLDASATHQPELLFEPHDTHRHHAFRQLEGGDILVLSDEVLAIGCSQRTSAQTIERVASEALFPAFPSLKRIYAVMMPSERSVMHLDTILTQIDHKTFLGHAPLVAGAIEDGGLAVARLTRDGGPAWAKGTLLDILREEFGSDVELVRCGGDDPLHQEREQWTDGANAICLSPAHIVLYARNRHTITALEASGFEEIRLSVVQPSDERAARVAEGMAKPRAVFSFSGSELSRARGGGRCLTMPLRRVSAA